MTIEPAALDWKKAHVVRVVDGDTTVLKDLQNNQTFKARHIGYNTPETVRPGQGVECYGPEASAALTKLIAGKVVQYAADPLAGEKDKYKRDLVHLRFDGEVISLYMIRHGLAFAYRRFQNIYKEQQLETEAAAHAANVGLWGACQVFQYEPDPNNYPGVKEWLTQQIGD